MTNPKITPLKEKQAGHWAELFGKALHAEAADPELAVPWKILRAVMAAKATQVLELPEHPVEQPVREFLASRGKTLNEWGDEPVVVRVIAELLREKVPGMSHTFGDNLPAWIRHVTYLQLSLTATDPKSKEAFNKEAAMAVELKFDRLADNPILIMHAPDTGKLTLEDAERATVKHYMEIQSLQRALAQPGRSPGRQKGQPKPPKSGKRPVDREEALAVLKAKQSNMTWQQIARKVLRKQIPFDPKARDSLRKHVDYLGSRGAFFARQKKSGE